MHSVATDIQPNPGSAWSTIVEQTGQAFDAFIRQREFPCLGAKASQAQGRLQSVCVHDITSARDDRRITAGLQDFSRHTAQDDLFVSIAVLFPASVPMSEQAFETALWQRLRAIHAIDRMHYGWDASVSDDPASAHFSMSIGGKAFYVVGLHPGASRRARQFRCPVLVFNLHSQFERLRADGRYEKLRGAITRRDVEFSGSANPMLAVHGKSPEARQYSGRKVDAAWHCPFHAAATDTQA